MLLTLKDGPCAGRVVDVPSGRFGPKQNFIVTIDPLDSIILGNYKPNEIIRTATYTTSGYFVCKNYE